MIAVTSPLVRCSAVATCLSASNDCFNSFTVIVDIKQRMAVCKHSFEFRVGKRSLRRCYLYLHGITKVHYVGFLRVDRDVCHRIEVVVDNSSVVIDNSLTLMMMKEPFIVVAETNSLMTLFLKPLLQVSYYSFCFLATLFDTYLQAPLFH